MNKDIIWDRLKTHSTPLAVCLFLASVITLESFFYWQTSSKAESLTIDRFRVQGEVLVQSSAFSIEKYFQERSNNLLFLADAGAIKRNEEKEGRLAIRSLLDGLKDDLISIIIKIDKDGNSQWADNNDHQQIEEGVYYGDRDYFTWAKEKARSREVFISDPLIARVGQNEGKWSVIIASPVYDQEKFNGVIIMGFVIDELTQMHIKPMAFTSDLRSFLVAQKGKIIIASLPNVLGESTASDLQPKEKQKEFEQMIQEVVSNPEGSQVYLSKAVDSLTQGEKSIIAYSLIKIKEEDWSLIISFPYAKALEFFTPIKNSQAKIFTANILGTFFLSLFFLTVLRLIERKSFMMGFKKARKLES